MRLLGHQGHGQAVGGSVQLYRTGGRPVHARDQLGQRRLARAARADEGDAFAGREGEVHVVQDGTAGLVRVMDTRHRHRAGLGTVVRTRCSGGCLGRRPVRDSDQPGERRRRRLGVVQQDQGRVDRGEQAVEVERGGRGGADGDGVGAHQQEAGDEDGGEAGVLGDVQPVVEVEHQPHPAHGQRHRGRGALGHVRGVPLLHPEGPYGSGARDGVQELLLLGPHGDALLGVEGDGMAYVPACGPGLDGHGEQGRQQEPPVQCRHRGQGQHDGQQGAGQFGQRVAHRLADHRDVPGDPGVEVSGACLLHLFQGQSQGPLDEALAQLRQYRLAEPGDQRQTERGGAALHDGDQHQQDDGEGEVVGRAVLGDHVHDAAQQRLDDQPDPGRRDHHGESGERQAAVRPDEFTDRGARADRRCRGQQFAGEGRVAHASTAARYDS